MQQSEFNDLTEEQRKAIFLELVQAQDGGMPVARSRKDVARRHGLSERQLLAVEREGLEADWPPLD